MPANPYEVQENQARTAAENIAFSAGAQIQAAHNVQTGDTQRVFQGAQRILNFRAVPAADGKPGLYLCNYVQGGFAIIAADRHMQPILAFAARGVMPMQNLATASSAAGGFLRWLDNTAAITAALRQNPTEKNTDPSAAASWTALVDNPQALQIAPCRDKKQAAGPIYSRTPIKTTNKPLPDDPGTPINSSTQVGPWILSTWDQGVPYNAQCRTSDGQLAMTGCVATAMAQVMRYWQYPATYQWAAMPYQVQGLPYPELARLMSDAGKSAGMTYGTQASSAYSDRMAPGFRQFGYSSVGYNDYPDGSGGSNYLTNGYGTSSYPDVQYNLKISEPVIFGGYTSQSSAAGIKWGTGSGHNWVCDGYLSSTYNYNSYLYFNMNWGWGGTSNGWYAYNNWAIYDRAGNFLKNYKYCDDVVMNIHP